MNIKEKIDQYLSIEEYSYLLDDISQNDFCCKKDNELSFNALGYAMLVDNLNYVKAYCESKRELKMDTVIAVKNKYRNNKLFVSHIFDFIKVNSKIHNYISCLAKNNDFYAVDFSQNYNTINFYWSQIKQKNERALYHFFLTFRFSSNDKKVSPIFYKKLSSENVKYFFDVVVNFNIEEIPEQYRSYVQRPSYLMSILMNNHAVYNLIKMLNTKNKEEIKDKIEIILTYNNEIIESLMQESKEVSETNDKRKTIGRNTPVLLLIKNKNAEMIKFFIDKGYILNKMEENLIQIDTDLRSSIDIDIKGSVNKLEHNIILFENKKSTSLKQAKYMDTFLNSISTEEKEAIFNHYYDKYFYSSMCMSHRVKIYQDIRENISYVDHYIFHYNIPVLNILIKHGYKFNTQQHNVLIFNFFKSFFSAYKDESEYKFFLDYIYHLPTAIKKEFILYAINKKLEISRYGIDLLMPLIEEVNGISKDFLDQYINFEVMHPIALYYALKTKDYKIDYLYNMLKLYLKNNKSDLLNGSFFNGSILYENILFSLYKHNQKDFLSFEFELRDGILSKFERCLVLGGLENITEEVIKKKRI